MAPGIDGLPAAERDVDVSGPVARFLATDLAARAAPAASSACAPSSGCPSPGASAASTRRPPEDFLHRLERSRFSLHHDLLLMAKLFSTLGYAVTPEVQARIGFEIGCGLRRRLAARAGRLARRHRAARRGRGMRRA